MLSERFRLIAVSCNVAICQEAFPRTANMELVMDDRTDTRISAAMNAGNDGLPDHPHVVHHQTALHNVAASSDITTIRNTSSSRGDLQSHHPE